MTKRMDVVGLELTGCVSWCTCTPCMTRKAATSIRRLLFARWLFQNNRIGETIPTARLWFFRWMAETGRLNEWNVPHDPTPMPERLHNTWNRSAA